LFKQKSKSTSGSLGIRVNDRDIFNKGQSNGTDYYRTLGNGRIAEVETNQKPIIINTRSVRQPLNRMPVNYIPISKNVPRPKPQAPMGSRASVPMSKVPKNNLPSPNLMAPLRKGRRKGLSSDLGSSYV
jgi:hypothetical protein